MRMLSYRRPVRRPGRACDGFDERLVGLAVAGILGQGVLVRA